MSGRAAAIAVVCGSFEKHWRLAPQPDKLRNPQPEHTKNRVIAMKMQDKAALLEVNNMTHY
ncbi:hypothetical protein GCAAIG_01460 [Candidatus Electronema halotolerans]